MSAILEIYFRFRFRPFARYLHIILHQAIPNFVQIEAFTAEIWRHIHFSRWRPRRLNTTSGFVSVDVTAFRRSKSIRKPNFVEISQMEAEIYFLWQSKMAWEGVKIFFQNQDCVNILGCYCYILWIQKCIFDACRQRLHNSGLICNQATALIILVLPASNIFTKFRRGHRLGALNTGGVEKIHDFLPISRYISQTIQNIAIVTMEGE